MSKKVNFKVHVKHYDPIDDDIVTEINLKSKFVSEGIGEKYKSWGVQTPVFISAQTGSGKNTFIEEVLIRAAMENEIKILLVSNRNATNRQQKNRIATIVGCQEDLKYYTPEGLDKIEDFKNIKVLTYQKLGLYLENPIIIQKLKRYRIVVFDECHFFVSDSLFNNMTGSILQKSLSVFRNSIRIYMTATPDEILPVIIEKEKQLDCSPSYYIKNSYKDFLQPKQILYYKFSQNYKYIQPMYFSKKEEIINIIKSDKSKFKWLIFVSNKNDGKEFVKEIGNNSIFIDADSKKSSKDDGRIYNQIINEERFDCKVLVATRSIDNGINLKDNSLKNIVIFSYDKVEFLQELGRKRVSNGEKIRLYLYARKIFDFNAKLFFVNNQIKNIYCFKKDSSKFLNKCVLQKSSSSELVTGLFYFDKRSKIHLNELAEKKLYNDKIFYEKMMDKLNTEGKEAFITEQLFWLGLKNIYKLEDWVSYKDSDESKNKFIEFLNDNCDLSLSGEKLTGFQEKFKSLCVNAYGKQKGDRKDRRCYKDTKMRKIFEEYNLPYTIKVKNDIYTLSKIIN